MNFPVGSKILSRIRNEQMKILKENKVQKILTLLLAMVTFFVVADGFARSQLAERGCSEIITLNDAMSAGGLGVVLAVLAGFFSMFLWWFIIKGIKNIHRMRKPNIDYNDTLISFGGFLKTCGEGIFATFMVILVVVIAVAIVGVIVLLAGYIGGHITMWIYCS